MMKILRLKLERLLPFLAVPRLDVPNETGGVKSGAIPPDTLQAEASYSHLELRGIQLSARALPRIRLYRSALEAVELQRCDLGGSHVTHSRWTDCRLEQTSLDGSSWTIVQAEGLSLKGCNLRDVRWSGVSLRDAVLEEVELAEAHLTLCDLFGTRLRKVNAQNACFTGVDLSYSSLESVDLSNADLRGCTLAYALLQDVNLEGARVEDTDLRGVRGLTRDVRADLRRRGARLRTGWIENLIGAVLERLKPEMAPERADVLARRGSLAVKLGALAAVALASVQIFWLGGMEPTPHGGGEDAAAGSASTTTLRTPTQEEVEKTKANLQKLRQAIKDAYETSGRYGVARFPTLDDLGANQFDRDGSAPGTDKLPLVEGGLPQNFLTAGEGVIPYCNDPASQTTLTGDDTDWHYCEETGRIYACGGFTDAPTLEW